MPYIPPPVQFYDSAEVMQSPTIAACDDFVAVAFVDDSLSAPYTAHIYIYDPTDESVEDPNLSWTFLKELTDLSTSAIDLAIMSESSGGNPRVGLSYQTLEDVTPVLNLWLSGPNGQLDGEQDHLIYVGDSPTDDARMHSLLSFHKGQTLCAAWTHRNSTGHQLSAAFADFDHPFTEDNPTRRTSGVSSVDQITDIDLGMAGGAEGKRVAVVMRDPGGIYTRLSKDLIDWNVSSNWKGSFSIASDHSLAVSGANASSCAVTGMGSHTTGDEDFSLLVMFDSGNAIYTITSDSEEAPSEESHWSRPLLLPVLHNWSSGSMDLDRYFGFETESSRMGIVAAIGTKHPTKALNGIASLVLNLETQIWDVSTIKADENHDSMAPTPRPRVATSKGLECAAWFTYVPVVGDVYPWVIDAPLEDPGDASGSPGG